MLNRQTRQFVTRFTRTYPGRTAAMVGLLIFSGLAEGIGIAALLPVITVGVQQSSGSPGSSPGPSNAISEAMIGLLETLHIPTSVGSLLLLAVFALFMKGCFRWLAMRQVGFSVAKVGRDLRERLVRALINVRWSYFTGQPTGFFPNAISTEARRASGAYRNACSALAGAIQIPVYASLIVAISWKIALASLVLGAFGALVLGSFVSMSREAGGDQTNRMKSLLAQLTDALGSIKPIKAMGREQKFEDLVSQDIIDLEDAEKRHVVASESLRSFQEPVLMAIIAVCLFGALRWGAVSFADILVVAFLFHRLAGRFHFVQLEYEVLVVGESAFWSFDELVSEAEAMAEPIIGEREPPLLNEGIDFEAVSFDYGTREVLDEITFSIPAGAFVAIVGPSGAGKTTILDLVAGLHEPTGGRILIDGIPLDELDVRRWRRQIGYVPQETVLFHDSVLRNIWVGREDADPQLVREALEQADAWSFVDSLPEGLDTVIGERGSKLSGGQRQRLAIARALIRKPRLLMLDEATTALDPATEAGILRTLQRLRGDVTVLAISHQRGLRGTADIVYELDQGAIRQVGGGGMGRTRESLGAAGG